MNVLENLGKFLKSIWDGMDYVFIISGYAMSLQDIFVWSALGLIIVGFVVEIIYDGR